MHLFQIIFTGKILRDLSFFLRNPIVVKAFNFVNHNISPIVTVTITQLKEGVNPLFAINLYFYY